MVVSGARRTSGEFFGGVALSSGTRPCPWCCPSYSSILPLFVLLVRYIENIIDKLFDLIFRPVPPHLGRYLPFHLADGLVLVSLTRLCRARHRRVKLKLFHSTMKQPTQTPTPL
jgi:hypothetical protein